MAYLAAAVVLVGVLCILNLVLTFGVVRRLREHTRIISKVTQAEPNIAGPGTRIGDFNVESVAGAIVSASTLVEGTLVGFFTPGCGPCEERMPKFIDYASASGRSRDRVLAVVAAADELDAADYVRRLSAVASVVVEPTEGPVEKAFAATAFPVWCTVGSNGVIRESEFSLTPEQVGAQA